MQRPLSASNPFLSALLSKCEVSMQPIYTIMVCSQPVGMAASQIAGLVEAPVDYLGELTKYRDLVGKIVR